MNQTAPATVRSRLWWPSAAALTIAAAALGATLLLPRLFSDPVGVDPYVLRLTGVAIALAFVALVWSRFATVRPILLAVAAMTAAFSVFAGGPQWIENISGSRFDFNTQVLFASAAEALLTAVVAVLAVRTSPSTLRPLLRLRRFGPTALIATIVGVAVFVAVVMLLPATLLGREGIAPVALARDLPLQGPASVLQSFAQELQFRGLILGALDRVAPPWAANLGQAAFFGLAHIAVVYQGPGAAFVPVTIVLGFVLGWVTQRTGSLWPAIVIHAVADIAVTVGVIPGLYGY
ncbi:MAG: CPBP family intramembrane metalloprotease [Candidatus Dormibacteraeota bacterium]|uniref:CPBP family intramembrane metalloprotease n=1 Tax=Candidatus Aeolococcus gillhamiae TaxID=3127015 RepID=A0A934N0V6_9BACT|nr:CPBP family intramembrane metalloprotease [Candidatus Dormibacteraeota bacterium]